MAVRVPSPLAALFAEQVRERPQQIALVYGTERLTYAELDAESERLARRLTVRGVGSETVVGLAVPRTTAAVIAWLGVTKVNAVCLWLGLDYPAERLSAMIEDSDPAMVVTVRETADRIPGAADLLILDEAEEIAAAGVGPVAAAAAACYVLYTSGSTGRPKGVVVTCAGVRDLIETATRRCGAGPGTRMAQFASLSFDVAFWEMVIGLLIGERLVMVPDEARVPDHAFAALLAGEGVTHAAIPPAFLELLPGDAALPPKLTVLTGADKVPMDLMRRWSDRCRMIAAYGVTEATVNSMLWTFFPGPPRTLAPIGVPDPGTGVRVLDHRLRPVAAGDAGELYLAGTGLARGYLARHTLTASRFVADPWGAPGERMYRTGDLVRLDDSGDYEFLGRIDAQLKVRGHRIEPGEVESVLLGHPRVTQALVTTRGTELVAFVVAHEADGPELRRHVAASLPRYMVPGEIVPVPSLPTLPSGKVNRRAVPVCAADPPPSPAQPPADAAGAVRAALSAELGATFGGEPDDTLDFVGMGGHSLAAVRVVARLHAGLGWAPPVGDLFTARTVADLLTGFIPASVPLARRSGDGPAPLSFEQERLWLLEELAPGHGVYTVPWTWRVRGAFDLDVLHAAWSDVIGRHAVLRTRFPILNGTPRQVVDPCPEWAVTVTDDLASAAAEPFRPAEELPFRIAVHRAGPEEHVVLICLHHIATDDWSVQRLADDLSVAYAARAAREDPRLPPLPLDFADFATWQRAALGPVEEPHERTADQVRWWVAELAGMPVETSPPPDRPRTAAPTGAAVRRHWPPDRRDAVTRLAYEHGATIYHVVHAALAAALAESGVGTDVVVGCPVAGRRDERIHDLVGFLVDTVVLRTRVDDGVTFTDLLDQVRRTDVAALAHSDVSLAHVVEAVRPPRRPHRNPLFQVVLTQQHHTAVAPALPGAQVRAEPAPTTVAAFDLGVAFVEHDGVLELTAEYRVDLYDDATVDALLDRMAAIVDSAASGTPQRVRAVRRDRPREPQALTADPGAVQVEHMLCEAFAEVLGLPATTPDDNFFDLGGHSLQAIRLVNAVRDRWGTAPTLAELFERPRIADLAAVLPPLPEQPPEPMAGQGSGPVPLSFEQERLWLLQQADPASAAYVVPWVWRVRGELDVAALRAAWQAVIECHPVLRCRFPDVDGIPVQLVDHDPQWTATERHVAEADLGRVLAEAAAVPFVPAQDLPFRVGVFHLGPEDTVVQICLNHMVSDDWTVGRIARDLSATYAGRAPRPAAAAYSDHGRRQRAELGPVGAPTPRASALAAWWQQYLAGAPAETMLPADRPRTGNATGDVVRRRWPPVRAAGVRALAREAGTTPYVTLHAALAAALAEAGAGNDIVVGCPVANRPTAALEDVVGFFVNTVPLRLRIADGVRCTDLLAQARTNDLAVFARSGFSFAHIVAAVNPPRSPDHNPLFQIMFSQVHDGATVPELTGARVDPVAAPFGTAAFDLAIGFSDDGDVITTVAEYSSARYDRATVEAFLDRWENLVDRMRTAAVHPRAPVGQITRCTRAGGPPSGCDETEAAVLHAFRQVLTHTAVDLDDDFFALGGHSLLTIRLIRMIKQDLGVQLSLRRVLSAPTPRGIAALVDAAAAG